MTYQDLYNTITSNPEFTYPFSYANRDMDYLDYVHEFNSKYLQLVKTLDEESLSLLNEGMLKGAEGRNPMPFNLIDDCKKFAEIVNTCINHLFAGNSQVAFEKLEAFLKDNTYHYLRMLPHLFVSEIKYYKVRNGQEFDNKDGEMFHLPFQLRHKVGTQRYSAPGYPTLYLAGHPDTSRREVNGGDWDSVTCCSYKFKGEAKYLDLAYPIKPTPELWELYSLFACYPLLMACMVSVKHTGETDYFKPEYALPQILFNVVRLNNYEEFVGVAYMSNKANHHLPLQSVARRNFAYFIKNANAASGYDKELASKFEISDFYRMSTAELELLRKQTFGNVSLLNRRIFENIQNLQMHELQIN